MIASCKMRVFFIFLIAQLCITHIVSATEFPTVDQLPLRTQGRWIVNQQGKRVKLACINWHGAHMNAFVPSGLDVQTAKSIASLLRKFEFNCIRLNWSVEMVQTNPIVNHDAIKALRLAGHVTNDYARALDILDLVVNALTEAGIMVILDNHISDAGWCCDVRTENGLWFNDRYPETVWDSTWEFMVERYSDNPFVIGADLRNELRPDIRLKGAKIDLSMPSWGGGNRIVNMQEYAPELLKYRDPAFNTTLLKTALGLVKLYLGMTKVKLFDWRAAAERVSNKIIAKNKNVLVFVQGTFDIKAYTPNILPMLFYYLQNDESLYNSVGKYLKIPPEVTNVGQLHNLTGVASDPIILNQPNRLVYSSHVYPFFFFGPRYAWDDKSPTYEEYRDLVENSWGYISKNNIAPVWVGETGTESTSKGVGKQWTDYNQRYLIENDLDFGYWPIGDARPTVDGNGHFDHGYDDYAMLNRNYDDIKYKPLHNSLKPLFHTRMGPGYGGEDSGETRPLVLQD